MKVLEALRDWRLQRKARKAREAIQKPDFAKRTLRKLAKYISPLAIVIMFVGMVRAQNIPQPAVNLNIIAQIESSNNSLAYNERTGASGMYQFMPIAWLDVQNNFPELRQYPFSKAYEPRVARLFAKAYFVLIDRYLRHYGLKTSLSNQLSCYNQGIGLTRKGILSKETRNYIAKYLKLASLQ